MKFLLKINNGILIILIGVLHTQFALSRDAFQIQFSEFSSSFFYKISSGLSELPPSTNAVYETMAAFWFFYFGILIIPMGILILGVERKYKSLPSSFCISYLLVILLGVYMIPNSGMTIFMLPHAIFMLATNHFKLKRKQLILNNASNAKTS